MKTSLDLLMEFAEKYSQKEMAELCQTSEQAVTNWKRRGGMSPSATVRVGEVLGYTKAECTMIIAIEAERTERGRDFLLGLAAQMSRQIKFKKCSQTFVLGVLGRDF